MIGLSRNWDYIPRRNITSSLLQGVGSVSGAAYKMDTEDSVAWNNAARE
jgi:hypothetical protein